MPLANFAVSDDDGSSSTDQITTDTTLTVSGFFGGVDDTNYFTLTRNGTTIDGGLIVLDGSGNFNFALPTALALGNYVFSVSDTFLNIESGIFSIVTAGPPTPPAPTLAVESDSGELGDDLTNVAAPTLRGTGTAGATMRVFKDGSLVGSTVVAGDGAWSLALTGPQAGIGGDFTAREVDGSNVESGSSSALSLVIDTEAPSAPPAPALAILDDSGAPGDGVTNVIAPTVGGITAPLTTVRLYLDGVLVTELVTDEAGVWSYALPSGTIGAGGSLTLTSVDAAANESAPSSAFALVIDTTAPDLIAAPLLLPASDSAALGDGITSDTTPAIHGTAEPDATVEILVGGTAVGFAVVAEDGSWTFQFPTLVDATYAVTTRHTDVAGNTGAVSPALQLVIDTTAPDLIAAPLLLPASDSAALGDGITSDTTPTIHGTAEPDATVEILVGGTAVGFAVVAEDGSWTFQFPTLVDATYAVTTRRVDVAGNTGAVSPALQLVIDTSAPDLIAAPLLLPASDSAALGDGITSDTTPAIHGTAEPDATVEILVGGTAVGFAVVAEDGSWTFQFPTLVDATYAVTTRHTDVAGNTGAVSPALQLVIDTAGPSEPSSLALATASDTGPDATDRVTADTTPTLIGVTAPLGRVRLFQGTQELGIVSAASDGAWSYTLQTPLPEGIAQFKTIPLDVAGNPGLGSDTLSVLIDTEPPGTPRFDRFTQTQRMGGADISVGGVAEAASRVAVFDGETLLGRAITDEAGNWTASITLADGSYEIAAAATDGAGNVSPRNENFAVAVTTGSTVASTRYDGPVAGVLWQFLGDDTTDVLRATSVGDFVNLGAGDDAVDGGTGDDVLDGGTGSNFLTGGDGRDVFFTDARNVTSAAPTWSTIADWQPDDALSIWGWRPGTSTAFWIEDAGAEGFKGATMHIDTDQDGRIDTSVTFAGKAVAEIAAPNYADGLVWFS